MLGFTRAIVVNEHVKSDIFLGKALEILTWGQNEWATATREERGSVLEDTWIRGIQSMRMEEYLQVSFVALISISFVKLNYEVMQAFRETQGSDTRFTLDGLEKLAQTALDEIEAAQSALPEIIKVGLGFTDSFFFTDIQRQ